MSETKFTKGPWEWECDNDTATIIQVYSKSDEAKGDPDICRLQHEPDAHLIACAPEMYEFIETYMGGHPEAEKLLTKARGE